MKKPIAARLLLFFVSMVLSVPGFAQFSFCGGKTQHVQDSLALAALYNATDGPNWTYNTNWLQPGTCLHEWDGVRYLDTGTFRSDRVWQLILSDNNLVGSLPDEIGNLAGLKFLHLGENHLSGELPASMANMDSLHTLTLGNNDFDGLPAGLDRLDQLVSFSYSTRDPSPFLEGFEAMEGLEILGLQDSFNGPIPDSYGDIPNLRQLILRSNTVTGGIPPSLANIDSLEYLIMPGNKLDGPIPPEIFNLTTLRSISLENNQLEGEIPSSIGNLKKLFGLRANNNQLEGELPASIGNLTALQSLNLSHNRLTGRLPETMGNLQTLRELYLSVNGFSGHVPGSFDNLVNLRRCRLDWNAFTGLPMFTGATSLEQLWVYQNRLTFEDILPVLNAASEVVYSNQDSVGASMQIVVEPGAPRTLFWGFTEPTNQYQWLKDGVEIPNANDVLHVIPSMRPDDEGDFVLRVTNPAAPELTLHTRPIRLDRQPFFVCEAPGGKRGVSLDQSGLTDSGCGLSDFRIFVVEVDGEVELLRQNKDPVEMRGGETLVPSDRIYTGLESSIRLAYPDGSTVVVQELTDVLIGSFERLGNAVQAQLWLKAGEVDAAVAEESAVKSDFKVRTPTATCSVRGTAFSVRHDSTTNVTAVHVADGEVVTALLSNPDDSVTVSAWQTLEVTDTALGPVQAFGLDRIVIMPDTVRIRPNAVWRFAATGYTSDGSTMPVRVDWAASGGAVDEQGYFVAALETGTYRITANETVHGLEAEATITIAGAVLVGREPDAPNGRFQLGPAYPNPFRTETRIPFTIEQTGPVRLVVYDLLGRTVAVLVDATLPSGSHKIVWKTNAPERRLPSGMYFLRLELSGLQRVRSVVLAR